jgi:hypothetical protein
VKWADKCIPLIRSCSWVGSYAIPRHKPSTILLGIAIEVGVVEVEIAKRRKKHIGRGTPHHAMKSSYYCIIFSDNKMTNTEPTRHPRHTLLPCLAYYIV